MVIEIVSSAKISPACFESSNGEIIIAAIGGVEGFSYSVFYSFIQNYYLITHNLISWIMILSNLALLSLDCHQAITQFM